MRGRALALLLAALALVACVCALVASRLAPRPGTGFEERVIPGLHCDGEPRTSVVREPFVPNGDAAPRCVRWTASFVAPSKMHANVETMLEGAGAVLIDGRQVVSDDSPSEARPRSAFVDLSAGVHTFVAAFKTSGGPAYFRVGMDDALDPHDVTIVAPLDDDRFFPTAAAAQNAAAASPAPRPIWQALLAALALASAGVLTWLAIRARRGLPIPRVDLLLGASIFAPALYLRGRGVPLQDVSWDELTYVTAGRHYLRNVVLGDYFGEAWRHNFEHAPNTKWILGLGDLLAGIGGARIFVSTLGALAAALVFAFGRIAFGRRVGVVAGALAATLPILVAHARIAGHDTMVLFWWCASMVGLACWVESDGGDALAAFMCLFAATAGIFSRATTVWILPILVATWLMTTRGSIRERVRAFPLAALAGCGAAAAIVFAIWPFMWTGQADKLVRIKGHWGQAWGDIEVYMGKLCLPAWHYFIVAFLSETPALLLFAAVTGVVVALRASPSLGRGRIWGLVCLMWLVVPFAQSVSTLRIGAGRYVIQAWPALLLFAAIALVALGDFVASRAARLSTRGRAMLRASPAILVIAYTFVALTRVEPYPLDYFNELVGGPSGVAARKMFEVPWWGEGNLAAVADLNRVARKGARVHLALWPAHAIARLRDDLIAVSEPTEADYVLVSHLQYFAKPPAGCAQIGSIAVEGAPLVDTYHCAPASPAQLGFAAMTRGAPDDALPLFREALKRDPLDPSALFGLGWAAQVKGNFGEAQARYRQAATRAAQVHDRDTQYFALFDLGTLYVQLERFDEARAAFEAARAVRPGDPAASERLKSLPLPTPPAPVRSSDPPVAPPRR